MKLKSRHLCTLAFAGMVTAPATVLATNGYFAIGYGAGSVGMGGVSVTTPQDALCVGGNPACLSEFISPRFDMGVGIFVPIRRAAVSGLGGPNDPTNTWSGSNIFLVPGMGFVWPFTEKLSLGFAAIGNGGMNTTYGPNFFNISDQPASRTKYVGVDMVQLLVPITVAYKFNDTNTVGFSAVPARQRFRATGVGDQAFLLKSSDQDHVSDKGHDYANGFGARIGWTGKYLDNKLTLGATYASKVYMQKFELYRGLFAEQGDFDIPENYAVGIAVKPLKNLTVAFDYEKILYSGIASVSNLGPTRIHGTNDAFNSNSLGLDNGLGFGWDDQTVYKLGLVYQNALPSWFGDKLTLRAGYNYGKSPIKESQLLLNLIAPGVVEHHVTFGLTYSLGDQSIFGFGSEGAITLAYQHAFSKTQRSVVNLFGGGPIAVEAQMYQDALDIAYTLKF